MTEASARTDGVQTGRNRPHEPGAPAGLHAVGVGRTFRVDGQDTVAVAGVDLVVPQGGFTSLIGPSGCGKSTLLRLFADLLAPTSGSVAVNGRSPAQARLDRELGMVFQAPNLLPWRTLVRNVTLPLEVKGLPRAEREQIAERMLALVGLEGFEKHRPGQLSGGMQQRASIARALSVDPQVLLMDEPFGALDEITRDRLNLELMALWDRLGTTVLFVTHSIAEAVFLSTEVVVMAARPGRVAGRVPIDLPHPRSAATRDEPRFHEHVAQIRALLGGGGPE
ncbi:MAG TPA: ABC transporter ATP-binding protein [Cellulomonas sp.]